MDAVGVDILTMSLHLHGPDVVPECVASPIRDHDSKLDSDQT